SNSLLEGLVFGARAGEAAIADKLDLPIISKAVSGGVERGSGIGIATAVKKRVKKLMWERVGILRERSNLERALREFEQIGRSRLSTSSNNFVTLAKLVASAALWREESRGGHFRTDFPETNDAS